MSYFYAEIEGNRGEATRCGTKGSGIRCHIRGWHEGIAVYLNYRDGKTVMSVYRTSGSTGGSPQQLVYEEEVE